MSALKLNLVVAACNSNGIGINGQLPWKLRKDMEFFKKITLETKDKAKQNAVVMGRKTWFSIPEKFRPLKGRVNVVLSRELKEVPAGVHICRSLPDAIQLVTSKDITSEIEQTYIIGGSSVYEEAMSGPYPCRIYLTKVLADLECDTFLPDIDEKIFEKIPNPPNVPTELQEENDIKFRFEVYDKNKEQKSMVGLHLSTSESPNMTEVTTDRELVRFNLMAAMCTGNRGIGNNLNLPWPKLSHDWMYYKTKTSTLVDPGTAGRKIVHIRGRTTWQVCQETERCLPNVYHIVISKTLTQSEANHPRLLKIVPSFEAAISYCDSLMSGGGLDSVWIMGGSHVYQSAINHPQCYTIYLTHVHGNFPATVYFPVFEQLFHEIRYVFLNLGGNNIDSSCSPATIFHDIVNIVDELKEHGVERVFVASIIQRGSFPHWTGMTATSFNKIRGAVNKKMKKKFGDDYVNIEKKMKYPRQYDRDMVHPGYKEGCLEVFRYSIHRCFSMTL